MLRIMYRRRHRNLPKSEGPGSGPQGRINKMRQLVTSLVRHERIEGIGQHMDESRGYAERVWKNTVHFDCLKPVAKCICAEMRMLQQVKCREQCG